ncbi:MAG: hypothetical protein M1309_06095 [Actinobacteria bacterium]|nr:hypothetical protein [Actinomycetota bacterium]
MLKKRKFKIAGFAIVAVAIAAILGGYALAESGGPVTAATAPGTHSRQIDYNVSLQVNGNLSGVNPKLKGLLPLNLTAKGSADVQYSAGAVSATGNLQLGGISQIVQNLTGSGAGGNSHSGLGGIVSSSLSDVQFTEVNHDLYVKLAGSWYEVGNLASPACHKGGKPGAAHPGAAGSRPNLKNLKSYFPGGPEALLKDQKTVGQESIGGVNTTHYSASVDVDKAITEAETALKNTGKTQQAARLDAARPQIDAAAKELSLDWWVDGSKNLRQVKIAVEIDPSGLTTLAAAHGGKDAHLVNILKGITSVKLDATIDLSHFNENFNITKPGGNTPSLKSLLTLAGLGGHPWHKQQGSAHGTATTKTGS